MPSPSVGSLEFTIQGKTDHAAKAVYALSESLKNLKSGLGKINATKALQSIAKLGDGAKKLTRSLAGVTKNIMLAPFKKFGDRVRSAAKSFNKFTSSIGRVFFYRAIRKLLSEIGDALKTGVNNLYGWSQIADGRFAASMDNIASSLLYFKNSIGAAVAPLINSFAPVLEFITDKAVDLLNVINQLLAKLTGASYWTKAVRGATSYGDAVSGAGDAAKEALRYLAPFDELNRLPADNGSSGGGASGGGTDYSGMFEIQNSFDQSVADFAEQIKNAWNTGDWEEVGTTIANKLNELIDNIPWKTLGTKVGKGINALFGIQYWTLEKTNFTNLGNKIAEFVNEAIANINFDIAGRLPVRQFTAIADTIIGFIYGLDGSAIGKAVADFVGGAISEAQTWLTETPFRDVGNKVGELITQVFSNINSVLENTSLGTIGSAIARFINGVLEKTDWTEVGALPLNIFTGLVDNIISFLDTLDWGLVTSAISGLIVGAFNAVRDWYQKVDWSQFGTNLYNGVVDAVQGVAWGDIASSAFSLLGAAIRAAFQFWGSIGLNIADSIKTWWDNDIKGANFAETATNLWNAFIGALGNIGEWVGKNIIDPFMSALLGDDKWTDIKESGLSLMKNMIEGIKDGWTLTKAWFSDYFVGGIKQAGIDAANGLITAIQNGINGGIDAINNIISNHPKVAEWLGINELDHIQLDLIPNLDPPVGEFYNQTKTELEKKSKNNPVKNTAQFDATTTKNYTTTTAAYTNLGNTTATKTIKGLTDTSFTTMRSDNWNKVYSSTATKSIVGKTDKSYTTMRTDNWNKVASTTATKTIAGKTDKSFTNTKTEYGRVIDENVKKTVGVTANWNKSIYNGGKNTLSDWTTWSSTANWTTSKYSDSSMNDTKWATWDSTANWKWNQYTNSWLNKGYPIWDSTAKFTDVDDQIPEHKKKISVSATITNFSGTAKLVPAATGGVFVNGQKRPIQKFASGGSPFGGQLFLAREAGPELVGTLGGHTAVMNNDQIVASVSAGVARAISSIQFHMTGLASSPLPTYTQDETTEEMLYNAFMRALADSNLDGGTEVYLDGEPLYQNVVRRNRMATRSTGSNPMLNNA